MFFGISKKRSRLRHSDIATSALRVALRIVSALVVLAACDVSFAGDDVPESRPTVMGTVTDSQDLPVADATVYLVVSSSVWSEDATVTTATTQANGTWSIELDQRPTLGSLTALVRKDGYAIGVSTNRSDRYSDINNATRVSDRVELNVLLQPQRTVRFRVQDAEGNSINDAKLFLQGLFRDGQPILFYWQRPLIRELSWGTSADGRVTVDGIPPDHNLMFSIESKPGESQFGFIRPADMDLPGESVLNLLPTCKLEIQLVADDPLLRNNRRVLLESRQARPPEDPTANNKLGIQSAGTMVTVRTDDRGSANAVVVAGDTSIVVQPSSGDTAFAPQTTQVKTEAGETKQVEIAFQPGIRVNGSVLTDAGEPIEGVMFSFQTVNVQTKADGTFVASIPATGPRYGSIVSIPAGYAMPLETHLRMPQEAAVGNTGDQTNASNAETLEFTLPPIVLRRASTLAGTVRNEAGEPVPGAMVTASWVQQENTLSSLRSDTATTESDGKFELTRVYPNVDVQVTAVTSDESVLQATEVNSAQPIELELTVTSAGMLPIAGEIRGSDGLAVSQPVIKVTRAMTAPNGHNYGTRAVEWNQTTQITGGDDGRFESSGSVARLGKYSFSISAPGYVSQETPFLVPPQSGAPWQLDPITLTMARTVRGVVRDSSGQPLAGATVSSWAASADRARSQNVVQSIMSDESGQFTLTDLHPAAVLAFVKRDGFRPSGMAFSGDNQDVQLTLYRNDESIPAEHRVVPGIAHDERRRTAASQLIETMLPEQRNSNHFYRELLGMMLRLDPNMAAAELSETTSADNRARLLVQLGEVSDSLAEVEAIEDGYMRTYCRLELFEHIEAEDERRELLAAALLDAQTITRPDRRAVVVAMIAEKFAVLGDDDRVATILREELPQVQALSTQEWAGFARGFFAAQFARVEPEAALKMASEAAPDEQVRHYQNVAHVLGNIHPELAEEALGRITNNRYVNSPVVRVVYRMASADLDRAIRLAEGIQDQSWRGEKARGLGVVAWAIRQEQPEKARELLQQAFAALPESRGTQQSYSFATFGAAVDLLRWAEQIDPERLTDYFWMTVSHYGGPSGGAWSPDDAKADDAKQQSQLILLLSLYPISPDLPQQLIKPAFEYWESQIGEKNTRFTDQQGTFMAMALADPERAVAFGVRFHQALDAEHRRYIPQPWEVIGNTLTRGRDEIGEAITSEVYHRWVVDRFDL